ncbi:hypothetical protein ACFL96_04590 [Thermoproteota archaeon]
MARIGLLGELKCELPDLIPYEKSKEVQTYHIGEHDIGVILSGIGQKKAANAAKKLLEYKPDYLIFLGFCGGAKPELNIGDLALAEIIRYEGEEISLDSAHLEEIAGCLSDSGIAYHRGLFHTFDKPVLSRRGLSDDILAVDMEAYIIAKLAQEQNVPSIMLKSVSDIIPEQKPLFFPTARVVYRIWKEFAVAKQGLNQFAQNYFLA